MGRLTRSDAFHLANAYRIPLALDFHVLDAAQVENVLAAADFVKYRQPRNANGSRARYFHAYLVRASRRDDD